MHLVSWGSRFWCIVGTMTGHCVGNCPREASHCNPSEGRHATVDMTTTRKTAFPEAALSLLLKHPHDCASQSKSQCLRNLTCCPTPDPLPSILHILIYPHISLYVPVIPYIYICIYIHTYIHISPPCRVLYIKRPCNST